MVISETLIAIAERAEVRTFDINRVIAAAGDNIIVN